MPDIERPARLRRRKVKGSKSAYAEMPTDILEIMAYGTKKELRALGLTKRDKKAKHELDLRAGKRYLHARAPRSAERAAMTGIMEEDAPKTRKRKKKAAKKRSKKAGGVIEAKWPGKCALSGQDYPAGALITQIDEYGPRGGKRFALVEVVEAQSNPYYARARFNPWW